MSDTRLTSRARGRVSSTLRDAADLELSLVLALGSGRPGAGLATLHRLAGGAGETEDTRGQVPDGLVVLGLLSQRQGRLELGERRFAVAEDGQRVTGKQADPDIVRPAFGVLGDLRPRFAGQPGFGQRNRCLSGEDAVPARVGDG